MKSFPDKYRHIFFDLDNTIWDFRRNSDETLRELYQTHQLDKLGVKSPEFFIEKYQARNELMWEQYRLGKITKEELRDQRFVYTFWDMGLEATIAPPELSGDYIRRSVTKSHLFPHAHETLSYLQSKYTLHIITNGFEEAQYIKLNSAGLEKYFVEIIISEHTGYKKPEKEIFIHSMQKAGSIESECLMVGDGLEVDVLGAMEAGWDAVYFNPLKLPHAEKPTYEIESLDELRNFL